MSFWLCSRWWRFLPLALAAWAAGAAAQGFPSRPLTLVVPYPAGGASDFVARLIQPELQRMLGQPLVVDNVGGVSGALGVQKLLAQPADGHTQVLATPMELVLAPLALASVKFKPEELRLAGLLGSTAMLLLVRKDLPANTLDELLAFGAGRELSFGSSGIGSLYHLMGERFGQLTGLKLTHVPYKGGAQLMADLGGGQIDLAFLPLAGALPGMVKEGRLKAIGITTPAPHPLFPELAPLSRHRLLPEFNFDIWVGVEVARATPEPVVARLNQALNELLANAEVRKGLEGTGSVMARPMTPAELDARYQAEIARYRALARSLNLQPQ